MDIEQRLQNALFRSTGATEDIVGLINSHKKGWNDDLLKRLVVGVDFPSTAYLRTEKPRILRRFFHFYLSGIVKEEDTVVGILNDVIAIGSTPMGLIWKPSGEEVQGFYPKNNSDPRSLTSCDLIHHSQNLRNVYMPQRPIWESPIQFLYYLHKVIQEIDPESPETAQEKSVMQLATFLALTLYRFATKNAPQMARVFKVIEYKYNLINLVGWPTTRPFSPPCEKCLTICEENLVKGLNSTSNLFIKVVHKFILSQKIDYPDPNVAKILAAALLEDTAKSGMEMISMLRLVQIITQVKWKVIMVKTYNTLTDVSWENLVTFLKEQTNTKFPQYSYHWARIIDCGYFQELAPANNSSLATVFGSVIAHERGNSIWEIEWMKPVSISNDAKFLGTALYEMVKSLDVAETAPEGADVMKRARELKHQKPDKL